MTALLVGVAGMAGVLSRYGISNQFHGSTLPWATVGINVLGSLLLGMLVSSHGVSTDTRSILGVGFLGGFTTFSTFTVQLVLDLDAGEPGRALLYLTLSLVLGVAAATCGYLIGRELF